MGLLGDLKKASGMATMAASDPMAAYYARNPIPTTSLAVEVGRLHPPMNGRLRRTSTIRTIRIFFDGLYMFIPSIYGKLGNGIRLLY